MNNEHFQAVRQTLRHSGVVWLVAACSLLLTAARSEIHSAPSLLPRPIHVQTNEGRLSLHDGIKIIIAPSAASRVREIADLLGEELRATTGLATQVGFSNELGPAGSVHLTLAPDPEGTPTANPERYTLSIAENIEIRASDARGLLWGVQTLLQAIDHGTGNSPSLACGIISDAPAYPWRAVMLDPVRSFLDLNFLRRTILVMSAYKLNTLHLHLIDDHAWRFESKAFPGCNRPGEPCYTQAELKDLVVFAQRYGVEIIPEFDFPGHAHAAVDAYPDLDCEGKTRPMDEAIFCAGKPFTWAFMEKVLAEAAEVFPSPYIHVGGDEPFAVKRWTTCPFCQARMKERGVTTTTALYHTFINDLDVIVKRQGRQMIVWNDAITPGVEPMPPKDILIDAWVNPVNVRLLAEQGYRLINSSNRPLYISSYGQREGFPLHSVWQWTPRIFGLREARPSDQDLKSVPLPDTAHVLGGQVCAWATEQRRMERRLYPRMLAVAETLWSGSDRGDYPDFSARLAAGQIAHLRQLGVPDDDALRAEILFDGTDLRVPGAVPANGFSVVDSVLHSSGAADTGTLWTKGSYRNFILTFERQAPKNTGETGFLIRCSPPANTPAAPQGYNVRSSPPPGVKAVAGDVRELKGWNQFEFVARDAVVSLTINGYLAWSQVDPAPRSGPIALTGDRSSYDIRNVRIRSLDSAATP